MGNKHKMEKSTTEMSKEREESVKKKKVPKGRQQAEANQKAFEMFC